MQEPSSPPSCDTPAHADAARTLAAWRALFAAGDFAAMPGLLHPDVVLRSPLDDQPLCGAAAVGMVLGLAFSLYGRFAYGNALWSDNGQELALSFDGDLGPHAVRGIDRLQFDAQGRVIAVEVFIRPLPALAWLAQAVQQRMAQAGAPAGSVAA
ncbi:nuclear transport factor 2 family protein [Acidovorax sp. NPDC077693]|uniref:nuclear transport factor 2 family protein n=1 Tax=unclassified Acidovorax TaxID=2684926 RepID=UPI0037CA3250